MQGVLDDVKEQIDGLKEQIGQLQTYSAGSPLRLWLFEEISILGRTSFTMEKRGPDANDLKFRMPFQQISIKWGPSVPISNHGLIVVTAISHQQYFEREVADYISKLRKMGIVVLDERTEKTEISTTMIKLDATNLKHCTERFKLILFLAQRGFRPTEKHSEEEAAMKQRLVDSAK